MATINSIYSINDWTDDSTYKKNDPTSISGYFRYSLLDHTVTAGGPFTGSKWGGLQVIDNQWIPEFIWVPTYPVSVNQEPRVRNIQFGDGYSLRISDGLNNVLLKFDLEFNGKTYQEALAISHFLYAREGRESFVWVPPAPFSTRKYFICPQWSPVIQFHSNYSVKAMFQEVAI